MILQCPSCTARFVAPDQAIGSGRRVRCGRCRYEWEAKPAAAALPTDFDALLAQSPGLPPESEALRPIPRGSNLPAPPKEKLGMLLGVNAVLLALAVLAALLAFKPALLGFTPSDGLALQDMHLIAEDAPGGGVLYAVEGSVVNLTDSPRAFPGLRISLVDEHKNLLVSEDYAEENTIAPGEAKPFRIDALRAKRSASHFIVETGNKLELMLRRAKLWSSS